MPGQRSPLPLLVDHLQVDDAIDAALKVRVTRLSRWVDRLTFTNLAAGGLTILAAFAHQWAVAQIGVFLFISITFAALLLWTRYYQLWFRLYLPGELLAIPLATLPEAADEAARSGRRYVRVRSNAWRGSKRDWLWTLPWGVQIKPRGTPSLDLRWTDMAGARVVSLNMFRTSDALYIRIRTRAGLILLLTARETRDWRSGLLQALQANDVKVSGEQPG